MPDLPSGTDTFLCTDIERSTGLWEQDRQAMAMASRLSRSQERGAVGAGKPPWTVSAQHRDELRLAQTVRLTGS